MNYQTDPRTSTAGALTPERMERAKQAARDNASDEPTPHVYSQWMLDACRKYEDWKRETK